MGNVHQTMRHDGGRATVARGQSAALRAERTDRPITKQSDAPSVVRKPAAAPAAAFDFSRVPVFPRDRDGIAPGAASLVAGARSSGGSPLAAPVRAGLEASFGADLSAVRVHAGAASAAAAGAMSARAFTAGHDIYFAPDQYDPGSRSGLELLAHEVAHTLQNANPPESLASPLDVSSPGDAAERDADRAARAIINNTHVPRVERLSIQGQLLRDVDRGKLAANRLAEELRTAIAGATAQEIRKRIYPKASAAGVKRALERHQGTRADLTGLGKLTALDRFAKVMHGIRSKWAQWSPDERLQQVGKAANAELVAANVPEFLALDKQPQDTRAFNDVAAWKLVIRTDSLTRDSLNDDDAAEFTNVLLHESRHAELNFVAARYAAGIKTQDASTIATEIGIPEAIAAKAVDQKFDANTDQQTADLGARMYQSIVLEEAENSAAYDALNSSLANLNKERLRAQDALRQLELSVTSETIANARAERDALPARIAAVEQAYPGYRGVGFEFEAHEVGDAAEQAYRGWPSSQPSVPPLQSNVD